MVEKAGALGATVFGAHKIAVGAEGIHALEAPIMSFGAGCVHIGVIETVEIKPFGSQISANTGRIFFLEHGVCGVIGSHVYLPDHG